MGKWTIRPGKIRPAGLVVTYFFFNWSNCAKRGFIVPIKMTIRPGKGHYSGWKNLKDILITKADNKTDKNK